MHSKFQSSLIAPLTVLVTATAVLGVLWVLNQATHSSMFIVKLANVRESRAPHTISPQLGPKILAELSQIGFGNDNLLALDLEQVKDNILSSQWIRQVQVQKNFPNTISISVEYREPKAVFQKADGELSYVDSTGGIFGRLDLKVSTDIPLISGLTENSTAEIKNSLDLMQAWKGSQLAKNSRISAIHWDPNRGAQVLMMVGAGVEKTDSRPILEVGQKIDGTLASRLNRLNHVLTYLRAKMIYPSHIYLGDGKKIVVRTARRS